MNISEFGNVVIVNWASWTVTHDVFDVINQIFFYSGLVEKIRQQDDTVDTNFLSMFAQFVHFGYGDAANAK